MSSVIFPEPKESSGNHYWHVLFNSAAQYPDHPTRDDKIDTHNFIKSTVKRFTCQECIEHAFEYMRKHPAELDNKESLMKWLCALKNNANVHAGKETIDCDSFVLNSLNRNGGCKSCTVEKIKAPSVSLTQKPTPVITTPPPPLPTTFNEDFTSVWNWDKRYPSLKRSINIESDTKIQAANPIENRDLSTEYPSLAGIDEEINTRPQEEELDGIIKPLDSLYAFPASFVGLKPSEMNLAYTPEMVSNIASLVTQMYLTNFGSLLTTFTSSLGLIGISVFAKGSLSHYDRLLVQNTAASLLFHTLNFINPRIRDDVLPSLNKFIEGVTTMNFDKIKDAVLYGHKSAESEMEKSTGELLEMIDHAEGKIDMDKLGRHPSAMSARDIQNVSAGGVLGGGYAPDLRTTGGIGFNGTGGAITKDDLAAMFNSRGGSRGSYGVSNPNYSALQSTDNKFGYILNSDVLGGSF